MQILPPAPLIKGHLYFVDKIDDSNLLGYSEVIIDQVGGFLFLKFKGVNICYDFSTLSFTREVFEGVEYSDIYNGHECIFYNYFMQRICLDLNNICLLSGTLHVFEGREYLGYPIHGCLMETQVNDHKKILYYKRSD